MPVSSNKPINERPPHVYVEIWLVTHVISHRMLDFSNQQVGFRVFIMIIAFHGGHFSTVSFRIRTFNIVITLLQLDAVGVPNIRLAFHSMIIHTHNNNDANCK